MIILSENEILSKLNQSNKAIRNIEDNYDKLKDKVN